MPVTLTRRMIAETLVAAGMLALAGCGTSQPSDNSKAEAANSMPALDGAPAVPRLAAMTVYRDPSCGCCEAWAEIARNAGYDVALVDQPDMVAIKRQHGVPAELTSCHTAVVGGYAIEGHVPLAAVARLLKERPSGTRGIAVPGMPRGSPGMEMPDGSKDSFQVIAFDQAGRTKVFGAG